MFATTCDHCAISVFDSAAAADLPMARPSSGSHSAAVSDNLVGDVTGENEESTTVIDEAKALLGDLSGSVGNVVEQFKNLLNRFMEATAVLIVTTCLIPVLVILFFGWLIKTLFGFSIVLPAPPAMPKRKHLPCGNEDD